MKKRLLLTAMTATLSMGLLGACGVDNNRMNNDDGVDYSPVRYDRQHNDVFDQNRGHRNNNNGVEPVRYDRNERGNFDNRNNDGGLDNNRNFNTDLIDDNRGANGIDPGTNGRNGAMRSGTGR